MYVKKTSSSTAYIIFIYIRKIKKKNTTHEKEFQVVLRWIGNVLENGCHNWSQQYLCVCVCVCVVKQHHFTGYAVMLCYLLFFIVYVKNVTTLNIYI